MMCSLLFRADLLKPGPLGKEPLRGKRCVLSPSPSSAPTPTIAIVHLLAVKTELSAFGFNPSSPRFTMGLTFYDDIDLSFSYKNGWTHYGDSNKELDPTVWYDKTFSSVDQNRHPGIGGEVTFTFTGTAASLYGDYNTDQRRFYCFADDGAYHWYNGGSAAGVARGSLNVTRCAVSGLSSGKHTLTFGQTADDAGSSGVTVDFAVVDSSEATSEMSWFSHFDSLSPPAGMEDTTKVSSSATPSSTSSPVSSSIGSTISTSSSTSDSSSSFSSSTSTSSRSSSSASSFVTSVRSASTSMPNTSASLSSLPSGSTSTIGSEPRGTASLAAVDKTDSASRGSGGVNTTAVGAGCGAGGAFLLALAGFLFYKSKKARWSSDKGTSYAPSQAPTEGAHLRSSSMQQAGRVNSVYSNASIPAAPYNPFGAVFLPFCSPTAALIPKPSAYFLLRTSVLDNRFHVPAAFEAYQGRPVSTYPEVQDDSSTHSPTLPYLRDHTSPVESLPYPGQSEMEELAFPRPPSQYVAPAAPTPLIPPSLEDPQSFRPR
ncbi:hypothetical protein JCM11641_007089 [Rhodosporidiobolus odoratus]